MSRRSAIGSSMRTRDMLLPRSFVAIDFETADRAPDSACAVGLVRVVEGRIVARAYQLFRPPRPAIEFTYVHGLSWAELEWQPTFAEAWPVLSAVLDGVDFLAAHNANFDRRVLHACCAAANLEPPKQPFACTVRLARHVWRVRPATLAHVSRHLQISLQHHHAASDAEACAEIVLHARRHQAVATPTGVGRTTPKTAV